jgi:hypothetical protein
MAPPATHRPRDLGDLAAAMALYGRLFDNLLHETP